MVIRPVPVDVVQQVDEYVDHEMSDAAKYTNREPLDESGVWSLHRLAADIYAIGFEAGVRAEAVRTDAARRREDPRRATQAEAEGVAGDE